MRQTSRIAVIVLACCVVVIVAVLLLRPAHVPDTQQIRDQLAGAVTAGNQHSIGGIMAVVSDDYQDENGMSASGLRRMMSVAFRNSPDILVTDSEPVINQTGDAATSTSSLTIQIATDGKPVQIVRPLNLQWRREHTYRLLIFPTTVWRVVEASYGPVDELRDFD